VLLLLTVEGLQLPVIPFVEVVGSNGAVLPAQIGEIALKAGVTPGIEKSKQVGFAVLPQKSVTDPELAVRQTW